MLLEGPGVLVLHLFLVLHLRLFLAFARPGTDFNVLAFALRSRVWGLLLLLVVVVLVVVVIQPVQHPCDFLLVFVVFVVLGGLVVVLDLRDFVDLHGLLGGLPLLALLLVELLVDQRVERLFGDVERDLGIVHALPQALEKLFLNGGFQGSDAMSLGLPAVEDSLLLLLNVDQLRAWVQSQAPHSVEVLLDSKVSHLAADHHVAGPPLQILLDLIKSLFGVLGELNGLPQLFWQMSPLDRFDVEVHCALFFQNSCILRIRQWAGTVGAHSSGIVFVAAKRFNRRP